MRLGAESSFSTAMFSVFPGFSFKKGTKKVPPVVMPRGRYKVPMLALKRPGFPLVCVLQSTGKEPSFLPCLPTPEGRKVLLPPSQCPPVPSSSQSSRMGRGPRSL